VLRLFSPITGEALGVLYLADWIPLPFTEYGVRGLAAFEVRLVIGVLYAASEGYKMLK
jgi:hypothetical protein